MAVGVGSVVVVFTTVLFGAIVGRSVPVVDVFLVVVFLVVLGGKVMLGLKLVSSCQLVNIIVILAIISLYPNHNVGNY